LGLNWHPTAGSNLGAGFVTGFLSLACLLVLALTFGARQFSPEHSAAATLTHVAKAGLTALCVAPLEEIVFRGALFGSLRKSLPWLVALFLSSSLFALLHYLDRPGPMGQVGWGSGLAVLVQMAAGFLHLEKLVPGVFNLTLVGLILGLAYHRMQSLYFAIGLHAGWIFWLKSYGFLTDAVPGHSLRWFGTSKMVDGWMAFCLLSVMLAAAARLLPQPPPQPTLSRGGD
jgi:membrane protease YdiL (CAAX protease family)